MGVLLVKILLDPHLLFLFYQKYEGPMHGIRVVDLTQMVSGECPRISGFVYSGTNWVFRSVRAYGHSGQYNFQR
jgi:hypothetical protein